MTIITAVNARERTYIARHGCPPPQKEENVLSTVMERIREQTSKGEYNVTYEWQSINTRQFKEIERARSVLITLGYKAWTDYWGIGKNRHGSLKVNWKGDSNE